MQLRGLELTSTVRLTQANDAIDLKVPLTTSTATIDPNFYSLLFFDMLNGDVTGVDGTPTTGVKFKLYDTNSVLFAETTTNNKLDWYENESAYISEAVDVAAYTVGTDVRVAKIEVIYVANNSDVARETIIFSSMALAGSSYATADSNGVKGVLLNAADGNVTINVKTQFVISK